VSSTRTGLAASTRPGLGLVAATSSTVIALTGEPVAARPDRRDTLAQTVARPRLARIIRRKKASWELS